MKSPSELKKEILSLTAEYSRQVHKAFRPAGDNLRVIGLADQQYHAGRFYRSRSYCCSTYLDFWLTLGSEGIKMEKNYQNS